MNKETLINAGLDYEDGVRRCAGSVDLYEKLLMMFLDDTNYAEAKDLFGKGSYDEAYSHVHEIKGMSGNLSIGELYQASSRAVEVLRAKNWDALPAAFEELERAYESSTAAIRNASAGTSDCEG